MQNWSEHGDGQHLHYIYSGMQLRAIFLVMLLTSEWKKREFNVSEGLAAWHPLWLPALLLVFNVRQ